MKGLSVLSFLSLLRLLSAAAELPARSEWSLAPATGRARRLAGALAQAPVVEPPWRDGLVRKDSLSVTWKIPDAEPAVELVELQHDEGFGGNFTQTLLIRSEYTTYQLNGLEVGSTWRFRLRAFNGAWSSWSSETSLLVCGAPSAPHLSLQWPPLALRPLLCWTAPSDLGGGGQDSIRITSYRIWMHLPGVVNQLAEVSGDRTCYEVDLPQLFSTEFLFSVNAVNQVYEGARSNTLQLSTAGPPGAPGPVELVATSPVTLRWAAPNLRAAPCAAAPLAALSSCAFLTAQFAAAPPAALYEVVYDAGDGGPVDRPFYRGNANEISVELNESRCFRFKVRAESATGEAGHFSDIRSLATMPLAAPSGLMIDTIRASSVWLSWNEFAASGCVWWYELHVLNAAFGNMTTTKSGLARIQINDLMPQQRYEFSVRVCDSSSCSPLSSSVSVIPSHDPLGPTPPEVVQFQDGILTVGWSSFPTAGVEPFLESFEVLASATFTGPYEVVGAVDSSQTSFSFPCNSTNATAATANEINNNFGNFENFEIFPKVFVKVRSVVSVAWGSAASAESSATRLVCVTRPASPAAPLLQLERRSARSDRGIFEVFVALSLKEQTEEVRMLHKAWHVTWRTWRTHQTQEEQTVRVEPTVQSFAFQAFAGQDVDVSYAVEALSGIGPNSEVSHLRVNLPPLAPELRVEASDDETVSLSWTWEPGIDGEELLGFRIFVDWMDGHFSHISDFSSFTEFFETSNAEYVVNCSDALLTGPPKPMASRSQQRLWFRVAAKSVAGLGEASAPALSFCSAPPDPPTAPTLEALGDAWALLRWSVPDLHGAPMLAVEVQVLGGLGGLGGMANGYSGTPQRMAPNDLLNVSAQLSQPVQFAVRAISEVGEGPLSPWLSMSKLALPPLPPRPSTQSSTDTQIVVEWSLDRNLERGAYYTGYYVYVSVDGTTWPDEDTGYIATWQDEQTTQYTMDCTNTALLGGQGRSKEFLWFRVASRSALGRGELSVAVARRCSAPPSAVRNLTLSAFEEGSDGRGGALLTWEEPLELHDAVLLGYQVYVDDNTADAQDLYTLLDVIEDPDQRVFRHNNVVQGQSYKYKVIAVSETGEGTASEVTLVPAQVPMQASQPELLDDCTYSWLATNGTTKVLCFFPHNYQLAVASVDMRIGADVNSIRVFPFVTVVQDTILEVAEEQLSSDGRLYLSVPSLGGWLWDDTPLDPSNPLARRLPALKFSWSWPDEVRAQGGLSLSGWHVYRSSDGVNWPSYTVLAASARNHSFACAVSEVGLPFWVRVAAVNAEGAGAASESLQMRCALPPGEQPAPTELKSDVSSVVLSFNVANLHSSKLLKHLVSYAQLSSESDILETKILEVLGDEQRVNISQLLPFASYVFKTQVVTEVGMSLDPGWQGNMSTGSVASVEAPRYVASDGSTLRFSLANLSDREWPAGEMPAYNLYITADDRGWPSQPTAVTDSLIFDHNCMQTPDYAQLDNSGNPTIVDQSYNFVYVKASLSSLSSASATTALFCAPLPAQPAVQLSSGAAEILLTWRNPDLFAAPLEAYKVYMDDGLGGEMQLYRTVVADDVVYDETNDSVLLPLHPLAVDRWFRLNLTVCSAAGESSGQLLDAQTCDAPPRPEVLRVSSATALELRWNGSACATSGYEVITELLNTSSGDFANVNTSLLLVTSPLLPPEQLQYRVEGLLPEAEYRFKVRAYVATGLREGGWSLATAAGLPDQMDGVQHLLNLSFASAALISWTPPSLNGGQPVGFELLRDDGPGTPWQEAECMASQCSQACSFEPISQVPYATGCFVSGLVADGVYHFAVRALNEFGAGPLSPVVEVSIGALPFMRAPSLKSATYENCTMTWQWSPAIENGKLVHSYELLVEDNASNVFSETLLGNGSAPSRATEATLSSERWSLATPGERYRAAVRAAGAVALEASRFSEWSEWSVCISKPSTPKKMRRDAQGVKAGRVQLQWDQVTSSAAGNDDLELLGVSYDVWGKPWPQSDTYEWRRLRNIPSHEVDATGVQAVSPAVAIDTFPETEVNAMWGFKLRIGNRNGYGDFSQELWLSTGQLASEPLHFSAEIAVNGLVQLRWQPPISDGYVPLLGYEAHCGGSWEAVANTVLSHQLPALPALPAAASPPAAAAAVTCELRAVNSVGVGAVASISFTLL